MMNATRPAAYVRKSHKDAASAAAQLAAIREMAARQGVTTPLAVYEDVGVSGRHGKRDERSAWARLRDDIDSGAITLVYVTALDRAGRSLREWLDFTELCVKRGVEVRDQSGQDRASDEAEDIAIIEMMMAQREGKKAVERSARGKATQQRRGDEVYQGRSAYGFMRVRVDADGNRVEDRDARIVEVPNPDEPIQPLLEAVAETRGNILQAARLLNDRGVQTRSGLPWDHRVLSRAIDRAGARRTRRSPHGRRRGPTMAPLSRLVACHCGEIMTPERDRRNGQWLGLVCAHGRKLGFDRHGRYVARSRHVIDRLREELAGQDEQRVESVPLDPDEIAARLARLDERKRKLGIAFADEAVSEDDYRERMDDIKRQVAEVNDEVVEGPTLILRARKIDWDADDELVGAQLRAKVRVVKLGPDMKPVAVEIRGAAA